MAPDKSTLHAYTGELIRAQSRKLNKLSHFQYQITLNMCYLTVTFRIIDDLWRDEDYRLIILLKPFYTYFYYNIRKKTLYSTCI